MSSIGQRWFRIGIQNGTVPVINGFEEVGRTEGRNPSVLLARSTATRTR